MAHDTVSPTTAPQLDRYGGPCPIAAARQYLDTEDGPVAEARELDQYRLVHQLTTNLIKLMDRLETLQNLIEAVPRLLGPDDECHHARAAVDVAAPYIAETSNFAFVMAGQAIAALERGGLMHDQAPATAAASGRPA